MSNQAKEISANHNTSFPEALGFYYTASKIVPKTERLQNEISPICKYTTEDANTAFPPQCTAPSHAISSLVVVVDDDII